MSFLLYMEELSQLPLGAFRSASSSPVRQALALKTQKVISITRARLPVFPCRSSKSRFSSFPCCVLGFLSYLHQCLGEALQQTPFWSIAQYGQADLQWVSNSILKEQFDLRRAQKDCNQHLIFFKLQGKNINFFLSDFKNANILIL